MYREYGSVEFSAYMTRLYHNLILQGYGVMAEKVEEIFEMQR